MACGAYLLFELSYTYFKETNVWFQDYIIFEFFKMKERRYTNMLVDVVL